MASGTEMIDQLRGMLSALTTRQKLSLAGGAVLTAGTLLFFVHTLSKPDFKPLYTNMEPADAQALAQRLTAKQIVYELTADGKSISVPADKLDGARLELASEGMPRSGRLGFELFDKMNWGGTEFDDKVNYQRALEGELERTIQKLKNVESVRVHLVMPTESLFVDRERAAKASVILNLRYGRITPEMQLAIARLASGAVDKLSPENVTVIDANGDRSPIMADRDSASGVGGVESEMSARILNTLAPVVGADAVRASVNVEYDTSTSEENQETYDPKLAVAVSTQRSDEQVGGNGLGGVPGTSSNVPGASANAKTTASSENFQTSHTESNSFAVSKVTRHILQPGGRIRRITAAVVVDDASEVSTANGNHTTTRRKRTPEELKQIEQLTSAVIGLDSARGDNVTVQNLSFQQPATEMPAKPKTLERVRVTLTDWSSVIRYGVVLLLFLLAYLLLLRPVKKQALLAFKDVQSRALKADLTRVPGDGTLLSTSQQALALKQKMVDKVKADPAIAGKLVQSMLRGGSQ